MEIELGVGLIRLADPNRGGDLLERVQKVRQNIAGEIGILMPKVRIRDNMRLDPNQYRIKIADIADRAGRVAADAVVGDRFGDDDRQDRRHRDEGSGVRDGREVDQSGARGSGRDVWVHGGGVGRGAGDAFDGSLPAACGRDSHARFDEASCRRAEGDVADGGDELIPSVMTLAEVQSILHLLLREQVSIRQLSVILETLGDHAPRSKDPILLTEYVRHRLARQICTRYRNAEGELYVAAFDPALEDKIRAGFEHSERGLFIRMSPQSVEAICRAVSGGDRQAGDARPLADRAREPADSGGGEANY